MFTAYLDDADTQATLDQRPDERTGSRATPHHPARLQADRRYNSLARQMHYTIELSYRTSYRFASVPTIARELGISRKMVTRNDRRLADLGLVEIVKGRGRQSRRVYPLPRGTVENKAHYRAAIKAALGCNKLDLNYRVLWLLHDRCWRGGTVKLSLNDIAAELHAWQPNVSAAIKTNVERDYLAVTRGGGSGHVNEYRLLAASFRADENLSTGATITPDGGLVGDEHAEDDESVFDYFRRLRGR